MTSDRPACCYCKKPLRPYRYRKEPWADGKLWGDYGDGLFCGLRCGYAFGLSAMTAIREKKLVKA